MTTMRNNFKPTLIWLLFLFIFSTSLSACSKEDDLPHDPNNVEQENEIMTEEQQAITSMIEKRNKAMIDKDIETMNSLMADDLILVHITGATQTKQEWLAEIANDTMRYFDIEMQNMSITVNDSQAIATYTSIIDARILGSR